MMIDAEAISQSGTLTHDVIRDVLAQGLGGRFTGQRVLVLIPDHTRSLPLPALFRLVVEILHDVRQLDFMVALGTHPPLAEESLCRLLGISADERRTIFRHVGLLNHAWDDPAALISLGIIGQDEIKQLAGASWHPSLPDEVDIRINKAVLEYDQILILGPVFPHEVVGFSGGAKYLFPGVSGPDVIHPLAGRAGDRRRHNRDQADSCACDDPRRGATSPDAAHAGSAGRRGTRTGRSFRRRYG
jgi:nickel-dependent lactate racemase